MALETMIRALACLAMVSPAVASAQAAPPTPAPLTPTPTSAPSAAAIPGLVGPAVAGVCLLGREELIGRSKVGQAAVARLRTLTGQVQATVDSEKARLEARGKAMDARRPTMTPQQIQTESLALQHRAQALQTELGERQRQVEATRAHALSLVLDAAQPFVAEAFTAHKCGLLVAREAALGGNYANDLTPEVLAAFDATGVPISFELEPLAR